MSGLNSGTTKPASLPPAVDAQDSITEYPWDEDDSFYESDDAFSIEANISTAAPNNKAGVYTESPNDAALRFGIRFTTAQFHETKLLKLLSDANAPHFLYKKVIEWGRVAEHYKYNFNPARTSRTVQVKYLEKWLQMQKSRPQHVPTNLPGPHDQVVQTMCFNFTNQL